MGRPCAGCLSLIVSLLCATGCVHHVVQPYEALKPPLQPAAPGPFMGPREAVAMQLEPGVRKRRGHYRVEQFSFDATGSNGQPGNQVFGRLFSGDAPAPRPAVIVLPVWGISEYPSRKLARDLLRRARGRIDIVLVESRGYLIDWDALAGAPDRAAFEAMVQQSADRVRDAVIDVRRVVDWLQARPQTDAQRIAVAGFSLSAVAASLALLHEPRLAAGVLVMPGSNPAEIFAVCRGRPGEVRAAIRERFGWSAQQYFEVWAEVMVDGDAARYAGRIDDPSRLLFIEAQHDDCMTQASRDNLWQALGRPERISFQFRHRPAFYAMTPLGFNVLGRYATRFLTRQLLEQ